MYNNIATQLTKQLLSIFNFSNNFLRFSIVFSFLCDFLFHRNVFFVGKVAGKFKYLLKRALKLEFLWLINEMIN